MYRAVVIYENERRMILIDPDITQDLAPIIKSLFNLTIDIKVFVQSLNAEVFSTREIFQGDDLLVVPVQHPEVYRAEEFQDLPESHESSTFIKVDLASISNKEFKGKTLLKELNSWAIPLKFELIFPNGVSKLQNKIRRTVWCCVKKCNFRLYFTAFPEKEKTFDELNFSLESFKDTHNHPLTASEEHTFNQEIIKEIDCLKGKMKTKGDLQDHINNKYNKNFTYSQISHFVTKLLNENFGMPDQDAYEFLEEIKKDIKEQGGNYSVDYDGSNNSLKRILYVSGTMMAYSEKFLDMVLVDATYKRNRFNMSLVNVVGINNYGKTILLAFGLMTDEKADSYNWFFRNLKKIWKKEPIYFISFECNEIINGKV